MDYFERMGHRDQMKELAESIVRMYRKYNVHVEVVKWFAGTDRAIFVLKLKRGTREKQVYDRSDDVRLRLRLPIFLPVKVGLNLGIVVAQKEIAYDHLNKILGDAVYTRASKEMRLPYVVGQDIFGDLVILDISELPHILMGGSTNSGKTVGLQSLITSIVNCKSPQVVNFILIDVGAADLAPFDGIPHLSHPVIRDQDNACRVLVLLTDELERRITLKTESSEQFAMLPSLVLVIDEFTALFMGMVDKQMSRRMVDAVSCLLQRGRHARIYVVLATQNPTIQNMKVDLGNITTRIAFKCAKRNFSETILGEGGAENLSGKGDLLLKSSQTDGLLRIKGSFSSSEELQYLLSTVKFKWARTHDITNFTITAADLQRVEEKLCCTSKANSPAMRENTNERLFAKIVLWVLGQTSVSCNAVIKEFGLGWNRANRFLERLYDMGLVENLDAKLPRKVLAQSIESIPGNAIDFLLHNGVSMGEIADACTKEVL